MFESIKLNFMDISYLDILGRARTKSFIVSANTSYILLANVTVPAVRVGLGRVFSCHFLIVRKIEEFACLSNGKLRLQEKGLEPHPPIRIAIGSSHLEFCGFEP